MSAADPVRAIADAVLYEGYVLWPYRRSALKNAQRWTFGGVFPRAHSEARAAGDDPWTMQTQCLVEGPPQARVGVGVRFLHVVWRQLLDADGQPVDELTADGERQLSWEEAAEREHALAATSLHRLARPRWLSIAIAAGREREPLRPAGSVETQLAAARRSDPRLERAARAGAAAPDRPDREHDAMGGRPARGGAATQLLLDAHRPAGCGVAPSSR